MAYWNDVDGGCVKYSKKATGLYIGELKEILECVKDEYEPPTKYFRGGINTYAQMAENFDDYVLFLRDTSVPPTNNLTKRAERKYKRKSHHVIQER